VTGVQRQFARPKKNNGCTTLGWYSYDKVLTGLATSSGKGTYLVGGPRWTEEGVRD